MNTEQEQLIADGLRLLIRSADKIPESEKEVWMGDYDKCFAEDD